MGGIGDILDHIEATNELFIELMVHVLTEFVTSLNESSISNFEIVFEVKFLDQLNLIDLELTIKILYL